MTTLSYRTKDNSAPHGKGKKREHIYFTCHPADFRTYFDLICEDIFKTQDCVIWYRTALENGTDGNAKLTEELSLELEQMRLFVIPITSNFLKEPSYARDVELKFAQGIMECDENDDNSKNENEDKNVNKDDNENNNIPILPIMMYPGLEKKFNDTCGNLQALNRQNGSYVSFVDLHEDKHSSDIATTASQCEGDQSSSGDQSMDPHQDTKSGSVNPTAPLYEDEQRSDYDPTAIPYEEKLEKFLSSVLLGDELIKKVKAAFDAHIFLSYRRKDRKYAQELMRLIHRNAFCRDVAIWYDEFLKPGDDFDDAILKEIGKSDLFAMVVTPNVIEGENYVKKKEYPKAKDKGRPIVPAQMVETDMEELSKAYENISRYGVIDAYDEIALKNALENGLSQTLSEEQMEKIRKIALSETDPAEDPQHLFFIGLAYLGGIDVETDTERAVSLIIRAADAGLPEAIEKLVNMYRNGDGVKRDYEEAIQWQKKLTAFYKKQYKADKEDKKDKEDKIDKKDKKDKAEESGLKYCSALQDLGDYIWEQRMTEESGIVYSELYTIAQELTDQYGSEKARQTLGEACKDLGRIHYFARNLGETHKYNIAYIQICKELVKENDTPENRQELSVAYSRMGSLCKFENKTDEALEYYEECLKIRLELEKENSTAESRRSLSQAYYNLGLLSNTKKNRQQALEYFDLSLKIREQLLENNASVENRQNVGRTCNYLGSIWQSKGKLVKAREYYEKSLEIWKKLAVENDTAENRMFLARAYTNMGKLCKDEKTRSKAGKNKWPEADGTRCSEVADDKWFEAHKYYETGRKIREQLVNETHSVTSRRDLSFSHSYIGDLYKSEENMPEAHKHLAACQKIREELAQEKKTPESLSDLGKACQSLGILCELEHNLPEAHKYYEAAIKAREELVRLTESDAANYNDLAFSCYFLGKLDASNINMEMLKRALEIWENLTAQNSGTKKYDKYIEEIKGLLKI